MVFQQHQRASALIGTFALLAVPSATMLLPRPAVAVPLRSTFSGPSALPPQVPYQSSQPVAPQDYTLGPGDRVKIEVFKVSQYNLETQVLVDGTVSLLQAGRIQVEGLTLDQASALASRRYGKLLRYPVVTVTLLTPRPIRVGVAGEVTRRGSYDLSVNAELNNTAPVQLPTVTRALKVAGGITQSADLRRVQVRRPQANGGQQVIALNLLEYVRGTRPREDIMLRDGDSLFVPTADRVTLSESYEIATTSFSADRIQPLNITVVGEVYRPGTHTVESNVRVEQAGNPGTPRDAFNQTRIYPTISRALQTAGGIKTLADVRNVKLRRMTQSGQEKEYNINLWKLLQEGDQKQDIILQDRDTIVVPVAKSLPAGEMSQIATSSFSPDQIRVSVVGEVGRPGLIEVPPNTPLNKAILAAGGFNQNADQKTIEFVRLNPDGTISKRQMPIDFAQGVDEQKNPALRNEDVIVVGKSRLSTVGQGIGQVFNPLGAIVNVFRAIFGGN
ncbi:SLBB domain-containing protein [filamentous cyanobacterium LEGE 11480]|uniref:SLBB domain-containing protein n=1 Tax=Romeriopsis navalis LEGE 11480 TaxID=2777977 RepID=A0A928VLH4_9CYAN|nr:SLBB domain-containing protein [Romeriopsis navalis]MBE9028199.1 SLBB domain-containing protein [Romeriopsis navalis LEGE 11480]